MLRKIKTSLIVVLAIVGLMFSVSLSNAGGLGSNYVGDGNVYVTITKNPHKDSHSWGFVNPHTGEDIELGLTEQVNQRRYVGYYENQIIEFWADGKNKRYYTGHGQNQNVTDKFVINGVHFFIESESEEIISVTTAVEASDCSDPDIDFIPVNVQGLQYFKPKTLDMMVMRIRVSGSGIDWTLFTDGEITLEVTFNNSCDLTYNVSDTIGYFDCKDGVSSCSSSGIRAQYEGYRLTDYDYPTGPVTYPAKIRVTKDKRGINQHYLYINNVEDHSNLVGSNVNLKVKLYQNGELIQAYEGDEVMTTNVQ
jgi:hypothetical protein